MLLTIFTPTYNRADFLEKLYNSLKPQNNLEFEWLIVDDGSSDNTEEVIYTFSKENIININYIKQKNFGKHIAINTGVQNAKGNYFFIVDSDDYLVENAIEKIFENLPKINNREDICGLIFNRINNEGKTIGGENEYNLLETSLYHLKFKYRLISDKAEIFKTEILRKYPFPYFENEKFSPEALIMYKMSGKYKILYINEGIYVGEYLDGGLTSNITKIRMNSPKATTLYYKEHFERAENIIEKLKCAINYYRFRYNDSFNIEDLPFPYLAFKIAGYLMYKRDLKILSK
ncbi:glycosyltransferase family 2 protein [Empedobacter sp.]|uniref:glycosyltransferase family 2 protein n=1 Tax=Empedobacter sp. TaxID=1927715 RepID=UPI0028A0338C|nr:glycosyltransferase family 2 protein [Empedobacter sp.]